MPVSKIPPVSPAPSQRPLNEKVPLVPKTKESSLFRKAVSFPGNVVKSFVLKVLELVMGTASRINALAHQVFGIAPSFKPGDKLSFQEMMQMKNRIPLKDIEDEHGNSIQVPDPFYKDINRTIAVTLNGKKIMDKTIARAPEDKGNPISEEEREDYKKNAIFHACEQLKKGLSDEQFQTMTLFLNQNGTESLTKAVLKEVKIGGHPIAGILSAKGIQTEYFAETVGNKVKIKIMCNYELELGLNQLKYNGKDYFGGDLMGYVSAVGEMTIPKAELGKDWTNTPKELIAPHLQVRNQVSGILPKINQI